MPTRLSQIALFFGAPLLLLSALTNSWWSVDQGNLDLSAGLTKIKVCRGALNCQGVSYPVFDANLESMVGDDGEVDLGLPGTESSSVGKSYAWAGSAVFWLCILGSALVVLFYYSTSDGQPWRPAAIAALTVVGIAALLAILFVIKKPNVFVRAMPLSFGYSFFAFFISVAAIGYGLVAEAFMGEAIDDFPQWSPRHEQKVDATAATKLPTQPAGSLGQPVAPVASGEQTCKSCGGQPVFREDVGCLVCKECGVLI